MFEINVCERQDVFNWGVCVTQSMHSQVVSV